LDYLSLFSGAGLGDLGLQHLVGLTCRGYVEYDKYCQQVLRQRIEDGFLDEAPIFGDVRNFTGEGYALSYQGVVEAVTAGFPCQPFSVAGKRLGENDSRNLWPETLRVIRIVQPTTVFLENVPGLLAARREKLFRFVQTGTGKQISVEVHSCKIRRTPYALRVYGDLAQSGYSARWRCVSAAEVGAPHRRDRLWIRADRNGERELQSKRGQQNERGWTEYSGGKRGAQMAHTDEQGLQGYRRLEQSPGKQFVAEKGLELSKGWWDADPADVVNSEVSERGRTGGEEDDRWGITKAGRSSGSGGATQPLLGRVAHGVPHRVDRLRALGNAQVPLVAAVAWMLLTD